MNKIRLIFLREYFTRVRKKSFLVMTFLGPVLFAGLALAPGLVMMMTEDDRKAEILVIDQYPEIFTTLLPSGSDITFVNTTAKLDSAKRNFDEEKYFGILYIPADIVKNPGGATLFSDEKSTLAVSSKIESLLKNQIENDKLKAEGIDPATITNAETEVSLRTLSLKGEENPVELATAVGFIGGILIYLFILMYGVQVMRGVIEEKTNRIVEVIISSVKPFELMMGKILGVAMVGLTQFLLWVMLTAAIASIAAPMLEAQVLHPEIPNEKLLTDRIGIEKNTLNELGAVPATETNGIGRIFNQVNQINFTLILSCFLIYFLGGYLLYSALFAAIGAAVDNETETQQFMLPVTIPLIISFIAAQSIVQQPDSSLGFWLSIIPFTSPVVMMVRIAFGVPAWELALSISLLICGFLGVTWLAAKIYRTGILMYGKKATYRELFHWLFYKP